MHYFIQKTLLFLLILSHYILYLYCQEEDEITFDGTQSISISLLASPLNIEKNELGLIFRTTLSTCVLFFASGISGDYIALELYHGRLRYIANSNGLTWSKPVEIIHGGNYADGELHQVNIEIGEETKLYTYSLKAGQSNVSSIHSTAADLSFDLDETVYFMGIPISERINSKGILLSTSNYKGCLNLITSFNGNHISINDLKSNTKDLQFNGNFNPGCQLNRPKFLKTFLKSTDELPVFSHINERTFVTEFHYRTYLQTAVIFQSLSEQKQSSVTLLLRQNTLVLEVNLTKESNIQLSNYNLKFDDGNWRNIKVNVTTESIVFQIDDQIIRQEFNKTGILNFPNELKFGGPLDSTPGFIGCLKDVFIGVERMPINNIMRLNTDIEYEEKMCAMKDGCFPKRPCQHGGRCIQVEEKATCDCKTTGYKGKFCSIQDIPVYKQSCAEYYADGFKTDGMYFINPGKSSPFKVRCEMRHRDGPMTIIQSTTPNNTFVFTGADNDKHFYYYHVTYTASKQQIDDLMKASKSCRQFFRYSCYQSTMLNSLQLRYSSEIGVRWYSKHGYLRNYWSGTRKDVKSCSCGSKKNCENTKLLCNCDIMDQRYRSDEGFITDLDDLPISKLRISKESTNHRSSFTVGSLQCTNHIKQPKSTSTTYSEKYVRTDESNEILTEDVLRTTAVTGNYNVDQNNDTHLTTNESKADDGGFYIDSKMLYIIVVVVVVIILASIVLYFRRRVFCCSHQIKARPQIIEFKEEINRNNNKNNLLNPHDVSINMDDFLIHGMATYTTSYSDSSVSTIDPGRYYQEGGDSDTYSLQSNKSTLSIPKKGILKIKKDCIPPTPTPPQPTPSTTPSTSSTPSITKKDTPTLRKDTELPNTLQKDSKGEGILNDDVFQAIPPPPPPRKYDNHDPNRTKDPLAMFREGYNKANNENTTETSTLELEKPPLKQKVLQLSTSTTPTNTIFNDSYFKRNSDTSLRTLSSCSSSKDSELNSDTEGNELEPLTRIQRSKSVRFCEDRNLALLRKPSFPEDSSRRNTYDVSENHPFFYGDEQKTLV